MTSEKAIAKMTSDVNVGIDEVVSVFVSQYEDNLFTKKKDLSSQIKEVKRSQKDLDTRLKASINTSTYETTIASLGLKSKVEDVDVEWGEGNYRKKSNPSIEIKVEISDTDKSGDRYHSSMNKTFKFDISKADVKLHKDNKDELESLGNELTEVMGLIKSVSRKERQVRGRISSLKLKDAGYEDLLNDTDILKLVQLD